MTETIAPVPTQIDKQQLARELIEKARTEGVDPDGLLAGLTKTVLETALKAEMSEHLGYDKHDPAGRDGGNSRNGTPAKTVLTGIGPVQIEVPRDRDGSFTPQLVASGSAGWTASISCTGRGKPRWAMRWKPALNAVAITFEGRIVPTNSN